MDSKNRLVLTVRFVEPMNRSQPIQFVYSKRLSCVPRKEELTKFGLLFKKR